MSVLPDRRRAQAFVVQGRPREPRGLKRAQVDRWRPGRDPLREHLPDRRREREPATVAPRRAPEAPNLRRGADEEPPVRGHGEEAAAVLPRSEEHTSELQSQSNLVCRLLLEKKKKKKKNIL